MTLMDMFQFSVCLFIVYSIFHEQCLCRVAIRLALFITSISLRTSICPFLLCRFDCLAAYFQRVHDSFI